MYFSRRFLRSLVNYDTFYTTEKLWFVLHRNIYLALSCQISWNPPIIVFGKVFDAPSHTSPYYDTPHPPPPPRLMNFQHFLTKEKNRISEIIPFLYK